MAIEKNQIHTDLQQEQTELEEQQKITISPEELDNDQDGPGRDDGYVPDPTLEQGGIPAETEIDRVPAGEEQEQISDRSSSKDMDWER